MKLNHLPILLAAVIGIAIGWLARGSGSTEQDENTAAEGKRGSRAPGRSTGARHLASSSASPRWMPKNVQSFTNPRSEADHTVVQRIVRTGLERKPLTRDDEGLRSAGPHALQKKSSISATIPRS